MPLEVLVLKGAGKIEVTGSLGDVMKESSKIAVSYVRSIAEKYGINPEFYKENDLRYPCSRGGSSERRPFGRRYNDNSPCVCTFRNTCSC